MDNDAKQKALAAALTQIEKAYGKGAVMKLGDPAASMNVETELEAKELTAAINRFLASLPREDRLLFVRRYWYGDPVSDLAVQTDSSANRISVRLFRLREKLRNTLKKEGFSP